MLTVTLKAAREALELQSATLVIRWRRERRLHGAARPSGASARLAVRVQIPQASQDADVTEALRGQKVETLSAAVNKGFVDDPLLHPDAR